MAEQVIDVRSIGISRVTDPRLRISGSLDSVRKRRERPKAIREGVDPELAYVQESDLHENEWWLHLFAEIAFYSKESRSLQACPRFDIENVVVRTKEDSIEACQKLKAENAIFYITYKYNGDHSAGDYKAIIRKTMDGKPGHVCLEVAE